MKNHLFTPAQAAEPCAAWLAERSDGDACRVNSRKGWPTAERKSTAGARDRGSHEEDFSRTSSPFSLKALRPVARLGIFVLRVKRTLESEENTC